MIDSIQISPIKKNSQQADSSFDLNAFDIFFQDSPQNPIQFNFNTDSEQTSRQKQINQPNNFTISKTGLLEQISKQTPIQSFPFLESRSQMLGEMQQKQHNNLSQWFLQQKERPQHKVQIKKKISIQQEKTKNQEESETAQNVQISEKQQKSLMQKCIESELKINVKDNKRQKKEKNNKSE